MCKAATTASLPSGAVVPAIATTTSSKRRRKRVSFFPKVEVKGCRHFQDYTQEEWENTWQTKEDLKAMKKANQKLAMEFSKPNCRKDGMSENGIDCLRGMEGRTVKGFAKRKRIKNAARNAVLDEQSFQRCYGMDDANALADVYYEHTEYAQIDAHMKALRDQVEALAPTAAPSKPEFEDVPLTTPESLPAVTTTVRKPLFTAMSRGDSLRKLHNSLPNLSTSKRLLTDKFFKL